MKRILFNILRWFRPCNARLLYRVENGGAWLPVADGAARELDKWAGKPLALDWMHCSHAGCRPEFCVRFQTMRQLLAARTVEGDAVFNVSILKGQPDVNYADREKAEVGNGDGKGIANAGEMLKPTRNLQLDRVSRVSLPSVKHPDGNSNNGERGADDCKDSRSLGRHISNPAQVGDSIQPK